MKATGSFEVKMLPQDISAKGHDGIQLGRFSLQKYFHGPLEAESKGEMLSARTTENGSAGYVAIEQVVGVLDGKKGGFVLQHYGIMNRGKDKLILEVVPDSGTGELENISGKMTIEIKSGKHLYGFDYEIT